MFQLIIISTLFTYSPGIKKHNYEGITTTIYVHINFQIDNFQNSAVRDFENNTFKSKAGI